MTMNSCSKVGDYFDASINKKKPVEQAMQQAFAMSPEQFDKTLRNYLQSGRLQVLPNPNSIGYRRFQLY